MLENSIIPVFDYIGFKGPIITTTLTFVSLLNRPPYLLSFVIGSVLNYYLILLLKVLIKEPRPSHPVAFIEDDIYKGAVLYGMPSGHAQISFFSITFLYLTKHHFSLFLLSLFIGCLTLYQRWKFRRHSVEQLAVGTVSGTVFAYLTYWMTTNYLQRTHTPKSLF
jgi:membrane-associated phospholipid phosphatase